MNRAMRFPNKFNQKEYFPAPIRSFSSSKTTSIVSNMLLDMEKRGKQRTHRDKQAERTCTGIVGRMVAAFAG